MIDRRLLTAIFVKMLLLGLLLSPPAAASPTSPDDGCLTDSVCRSHYNQAVKLFEDGRFEVALGEFQAAYDRRQMPWILINIGRTLHRLGRAREALEYYERYKQAEPKADAETQGRLEKYIAQARSLAGTTSGATPTSAPTTTPPTTTATPPTETPAATPAVTTAPAEPDKAPADAPKPVYKKWWFWTAIGGGVALVAIIGIAAGVAANSSGGLPDNVMKVTLTF